jgi:hypothetical protein
MMRSGSFCWRHFCKKWGSRICDRIRIGDQIRIWDWNLDRIRDQIRSWDRGSVIGFVIGLGSSVRFGFWIRFGSRGIQLWKILRTANSRCCLCDELPQFYNKLRKCQTSSILQSNLASWLRQSALRPFPLWHSAESTPRYAYDSVTHLGAEHSKRVNTSPLQFKIDSPPVHIFFLCAILHCSQGVRH